MNGMDKKVEEKRCSESLPENFCKCLKLPRSNSFSQSLNHFGITLYVEQKWEELCNKQLLMLIKKKAENVSYLKAKHFFHILL